MPDAAIDACCLIDLLASGDAEAILRASGFTWHLPSAVQGEVQYRRQHDPAQPGKTVKVPVDLSGLISSGVLTVCHPAEPTRVGPVHPLRGAVPVGRRGDVSGPRRTAQVDRGHRRPQSDSGRAASGPDRGKLS